MTILGKIVTCGTFIRPWEHVKINLYPKYYIQVKENLRQSTKSLRCNYCTSATRLHGNIAKNGTFKARNKSEVKRLLLLAKSEKWKLTGAIAFLIVSSTVTMAVPFCLGKIIDVIYTEDKAKTRDNLNKLSLALLGVFILGGICNFGRIYFMSTSGYRITQSLRKKAYTAMLSQETGMFDRVSTGELVGRLTGKIILTEIVVIYSSSISNKTKNPN